MSEEIDLSALSEKTREEVLCGRKMLASKDTKLSPIMEMVNATADPNRRAQILGNAEPPRGVKVNKPDRVPTFNEPPPVVGEPPKAAPRAEAAPVKREPPKAPPSPTAPGNLAK